MPPSAARRLIVNADDFGQTTGITDGILLCVDEGIVTSTSLMVRWPAAPAAAAEARRRPRLSVGLHVDLGEWTIAGDEWTSLYRVVDTADAAAVTREVAGQVDAFRRMMGGDPTHIDSHQHVHRASPVREIVGELAAAIGVPVRDASAGVRYLGAFYGQGDRGVALPGALTAEHLIELLRALLPGTTELGCHPGLRDDAQGLYITERAREVEALCDPRVRAVLDEEGIELVSFSSK